MDTLRFRVTELSANVPEGVPIEWGGRDFGSGPLAIELDESAGPSAGTLDYARRRAEAEFHVTLRFPEFAGWLESLGMDAELGRPIRALLRSEGEILEDHGFALSGGCQMERHALLPDGEGAASVLPGH